MKPYQIGSIISIIGEERRVIHQAVPTTHSFDTPTFGGDMLIYAKEKESLPSSLLKKNVTSATTTRA